MKNLAKAGTSLLFACMVLSSCGGIDAVSQKVMDDINSIGEVELSDQLLIEKTESTYATLTDKQKEQVNNYATLLTARDELDKLITEKKEEEERFAEEQRLEEEKKAEEERIKAEEERKKLYTHEVKYCVKAILTLKNSLKNPESLQVHALNYFNLKGQESVDIDASAQNGFGGMNRKCYLVTDDKTLGFGGVYDRNTGMYCSENPLADSNTIELRKDYDDVDEDLVFQLLAEYDESNDPSIIDD